MIFFLFPTGRSKIGMEVNDKKEIIRFKFILLCILFKKWNQKKYQKDVSGVFGLNYKLTDNIMRMVKVKMQNEFPILTKKKKGIQVTEAPKN